MRKRDLPERMFCNSLKWVWITFLLFNALLLIPPAAWSENDLVEVKVAEALHPAFKHLLALTGPAGSLAVDQEIIDGLLDFVVAPKEGGRLYFADGVFEATSAYHEFTIERDLAHILKLSYNPELPSFLMNPSSIRHSFWSEFSDGKQNLTKLWDYLDSLDVPVLVRGREITENTPDLHTGAYYRYGSDRTLVLMKHNGNNVLISLSKQAGVSEVGRRGVVLGSDSDWTYLYSDKKGLNTPGLGWVSSYMYDAFSIIVYYETQKEVTRVKCGVFKWLDAGWQKINMVKKHHIYKGLQRFSQDYKSISENPSLPDVTVMAEAFSKITAMEMGELRQLNRSYLKSIRTRYANDESLSSKWVADLLEDGQVEKMDKHELKSVLMLEYFKSLLGKP